MFEEIKKSELDRIIKILDALVSKKEKLSDAYYKMVPPEDHYKHYNFIQKYITKRKEYAEYKKELLKDEKERKKYESLKKSKHDELIVFENKISKVEEMVNAIKNANTLKELGIDSLTKYNEYCSKHKIEKDMDTVMINFPNLTHNNEFMLSTVIKDPFTIKYDKTYDTGIYRACLERLYDYLEKKDKTFYSTEIKDINIMLDIINNEANLKSENGLKFIGYLKEVLRNVNKDKIVFPDISKAFELFDTEYGRELEKLYKDKSIVVGVHGTTYYDEDNKILKEGIKTSTQRDWTVNCLAGTVMYNVPFLNLLAYDGRYNYVVTIPKDALSINPNVPIWGGNDEDINHDYLLPQYVYGVYNSNTPGEKMVRYDGVKAEYKYLYLDRTTKPLEELEKTR